MKLGSITKIRTGKLDANAASDDGQYPFFTCSQDILRISTYSYDCECVLVAGNGDLNVKYYNGKFDAYQRTYIIENNFDSNLSMRYLYYFLKRYVHTLRRQSIGGVIKYIKLENLTEADLPLPKINIQNEIVEKLDRISEIIIKQNQQLAKLDTLVKSRFIEMFGDLYHNSMGWPIKSFTDCATIESNMIHDFTGYEDFPHIGIDSIEKNTGVLKGYRTVHEDGIISGKYLFTPQHIIYSKIRPNLNKVALPDFEGVCSADSYAILPKENVCNRFFLAYVMRSPMFLDYILPFSNRTNLPKVNRKQVEGFNLPAPPIALQNQFAAFVQQVDKSKSVLQKLLEKQELLRAALMQEYFG